MCARIGVHNSGVTFISNILMNEQITDEQKSSLTKALAIVGFIALIIFTVWLAVQIVRVLPNAFSSLASLADSVYNYEESDDFLTAPQKSVVNAGESFTITWSEVRNDGTYTFTYACADGVAVDMRTSGNDIVSIACDTPTPLDTATQLELVISSEKARFVDVKYTITFTPTSGDPIETASTVTIVNATIPTSGIVPEDEISEEDDEETPTSPEVSTPRPSTPTYTPGTPTTIRKVIYGIPTSDPNGKIDLAVTFLGVGTLNGKVFTPKSKIDIDDMGAVQFEVKNIGTKTAEDWEYEVELPFGMSHVSGDQKALKPNERAVITLGFEGLTQTGTERIEAQIDAKGDIRKNNDSFVWSVTFTD